jgi:hypothetical protein
MSADINLLPSRAKFQAAKMKLKRMVTVFMWVFAVFWLTSVAVIMVIFYIFRSGYNTADKKYQTQANLYKSMLGDASISYQVKYKAKMVGKVINDRFEYGKSIKKITGIFSSDISLDNYEIKGIKQFLLTGSVTDGRNLNEVEKKIKEINAGELPDFLSAKLTNLNYKNSNLWSFTMEVGLK